MTTTVDSITIDPQTLRDRLEQGLPTAVLDVRPAADRAEWRVPGSESVDAYADLQHGDAPALENRAAERRRLFPGSQAGTLEQGANRCALS